MPNQSAIPAAGVGIPLKVVFPHTNYSSEGSGIQPPLKNGVPPHLARS